MNSKVITLCLSLLIFYYPVNILPGNMVSWPKTIVEDFHKGNAENIASAETSATNVVQKFNKEFHEGNASNIALTEDAATRIVQKLHAGNTVNIVVALAQGKKVGEILIDYAQTAAEQAFAASLTTAIVKITGYPTVPTALAAMGSTVKAGAIAVAPYAAAATAGTLVVGAGGYYTYRYFYPYIPTHEEQLAEAEYSFFTCLKTNTGSAINRRGFPTTCENYAHAYELLVGEEQAEERMRTFKKYNVEGLE